jgi:PEP-CTERM motif
MRLDGEVLDNGQVKFDSASISFSGSATTVLEPSSMLLLGTGIMGIVGARRRWLHRSIRR